MSCIDGNVGWAKLINILLGIFAKLLCCGVFSCHAKLLILSSLVKFKLQPGQVHLVYLDRGFKT